MEGPSRSSRKYLVLEVWCGVLTVAMVVMAAFLFSIKPRSTEEEVSTVKPPNVIPTAYPNPSPNLLKSTGSPFSHIQLTNNLLEKPAWKISTPECPSCHLTLRNDSIHFAKSGLYFIYAQVTFMGPDQNADAPKKSVILKKNERFGTALRVLAEGNSDKTDSHQEVSVWVANVVSLTEGDSVSLDVKGEFLKDTSLTFWGAYELR
ncbi:uncharacterized protein ACO6RY_12759 [Pungitius sinensis]